MKRHRESERVTRTPQQQRATAAARSVFRHPAFAVIWVTTVVSNVGTWMYNAASGWLMVSLNPDPPSVSLVQVATSLPMFPFALPAGALADIIDKRRFLIALEAATTAVCAWLIGCCRSAATTCSRSPPQVQHLIAPRSDE